MTATELPSSASVYDATQLMLRTHSQVVGLVRAATIVRSAAAPGTPVAVSTMEQVSNALDALVRAGEAAPYGLGGWQWRDAPATLPALYLTVDAPGNPFGAPLYAGEATEAHHHLAAGIYSGHYTDHRRTNTPVSVTINETGTCLLGLACGQCPPTFDARTRPIHRRGCPSY